MNSQTKGSMHGIGKRRLMVYSLIASAAIAALALTYTAPRAADAAAPGSAAKPVTFEALPSGVKRVTLTARAAERLGIATDKVSEQTVIRRQMVGGLVIAPTDPRAAPQPGSGKGSSRPCKFQFPPRNARLRRDVLRGNRDGGAGS